MEPTIYPMLSAWGFTTEENSALLNIGGNMMALVYSFAGSILCLAGAFTGICAQLIIRRKADNMRYD